MRPLNELQRRRQFRQAHREGRTRLDYAPLEVWIEPTNHCNLKCVKCPHSVGLKRPKGFMEPDLFRKIVDEIADYAFTVSLHLGGESIIHKELAQLIGVAEDRGLRTVLHTNATLLTPERSRALIESGLSLISFSIDGEDKDTYEAIDTGADFEKTLAGVATFLEEKRVSGRRAPFTVVQMLTSNPVHRRAQAPHRLLDLGADYVKVADFHAWGGEFSHQENGVPARNFEEIRTEPGQYAPCNNLWYGIAVLWDGSVSPCCMDMEGEYPVGNVRESSVLDLWNNDRMVELRRALVEGRYRDVHLCRDCAYLWGKTPSSMMADARGMMKQALRQRLPSLGRALGMRRWGVRDWNA